MQRQNKTKQQNQNQVIKNNENYCFAHLCLKICQKTNKQKILICRQTNQSVTHKKKQKFATSNRRFCVTYHFLCVDVCLFVLLSSASFCFSLSTQLSVSDMNTANRKKKEKRKRRDDSKTHTYMQHTDTKHNH